MGRTRDRLLREIAQGWEDLWDLLRQVPSSRMEEPGAVGEWSARDLLGHIATWERETVRYVHHILSGQRPPRYGGIDRFNAQAVERLRPLPLPEVWDLFRTAHREVLDTLSRVPEEVLGRPAVRRRVRLDTVWHYRDHRADLLRWLRRG